MLPARAGENPALRRSHELDSDERLTMSLRAQSGRVAAVVLLLGVAMLAPASAQVLNSAAGTITLQAVLTQSLAVNLSANSVNFNLTSGSANNAGSTAITATTSWTLKPSIGSVKLYAFFASSAAALTDGAGNNIPSADFQISNNAGPYNALT